MKPITWQEYEYALLQRLTYDFPSPSFRVYGSREGKQHRAHGSLSGVSRQLDSAVYRGGVSRPYLVCDAKRYMTRRITVKDVEAFLGLIEDVGAQMGLIASPRGFSEAAERRASAARVTLKVMSTDDALVFRWLPLAKEIYPHDWIFHTELAQALESLRGEPNDEHISQALDSVAFEEWTSFVDYAIANNKDEARRFLIWVVEHHHDEGWVFNAAQYLLIHEMMSVELAKRIALSENSEIQSLLDEYGLGEHMESG